MFQARRVAISGWPSRRLFRWSNASNVKVDNGTYLHRAHDRMSMWAAEEGFHIDENSGSSEAQGW